MDCASNTANASGDAHRTGHAAQFPAVLAQLAETETGSDADQKPMRLRRGEMRIIVSMILVRRA
jgi:hypothetical protein